jgi:hypothetical protein
MRATFLLFLLLPGLQASEAIAPPPRVGIVGVQRHLTLQQAVELAIAANLDVAIERTNADSAAQAWYAAKGAFDPVFRWLPSFGNLQTPAQSLLQGSGGVTTQHSAGQTFAFHQQTPWSGLTLDVQFGSSRVTNANPFVSLSPFYVPQLTFAVTQPLMRGRRDRFQPRSGCHSPAAMLPAPCSKRAPTTLPRAWSKPIGTCWPLAARRKFGWRPPRWRKRNWSATAA